MKKQFSSVPTLVLALSLLATAITSLSAYLANQKSADVSFMAESDKLRDALTDVMSTYSMVLRAGAGFIENSPNLSADTWKTYVDRMQFETTFPGLQGIGYAPFLEETEIPQFVAEQRQYGRPDFSHWPSGPRDRYSTIAFLAPEDERNRRAIGFDMLSEPIRRRAMLSALQTGQPRLTEKVTLVQEAGASQQAGTLLYLSVRRTSNGIESTGVVYAAFRMDDLIGRALARQLPDTLHKLSFAIYSGSSRDDAHRLYPTELRQSEAAFSRSASGRKSTQIRVTVAGAQWLLTIDSRPAFDKVLFSNWPFLVVFAGALFSLALYGITSQLRSAYTAAERLTERLSHEVRVRKIAEDALEISNRELVHRAKNALAVVAAIVSQTARHSKTLEEFTREFKGRLISLVRVQDMLRVNAARAMDLRELTDGVLQPHVGSAKDRLWIAGPALPLTSNEALNFSLILNELATNAIKYGALSVETGTIHLEWKLGTNAADATCLTFSWSERGGPAIDTTPKHKGFGSAMLHTIIVRTMQGTLTSNYRAEGLHCHFEIPWTRSE